MKYILTFILLVAPLLANENMEFEDDFLNSLDEVSEIATKTKLNIDDTPSFVSVLHSDKLQKLGVDNVFEALRLVPGVQLKKEVSGVPVVVFRGVTQKGEVKLMIDGVTINNSYRGSVYYYLDFPIEMIERIEVIRGAGSILYGSGAISGVINIITKSSQNNSKNKIFTSAGTYNNYKNGAIISTNLENFKLTLDGYYQKNNKTVKESDRHLKDYSLGINIQNEQFEFISRIKKSDIGNAYGIFGVVDEDRDKYNNENNSFFTQLSYKNNINKNNKINLLAGYTSYEQVVQALHPSKGTVDANYKENSYFSEINLISTSLANNELLIGVKFESSKTLESKWSAEKPYIPYISDPNLDRKIYSLYLNDNYSVSSDFDISAGLRYDHYSDYGNSYSPNLGIVYRLNPEIRLKALYSHSFRAPSWVELTDVKLSGYPDLEAETSDSIEMGIVFKPNPNNILRVNLFTSKIKNMIAKDSTGHYVQDSQNHFYGSEIEYIYSPNTKTELNFFASYIKAEDEDGNDLADVANILASTSLTYEFDSHFTFGSLLRYVSSSKRSSLDTREKMKDSLIFNQTISYAFKDFTASLIIKDLFDAGTNYALPRNNNDTDFDDDGRGFLIKASMEF